MRVKALIEVYVEDVAARASLAQSSRERYIDLAADLVTPACDRRSELRIAGDRGVPMPFIASMLSRTPTV